MLVKIVLLVTLAVVSSHAQSKVSEIVGNQTIKQLLIAPLLGCGWKRGGVENFFP